MNTSCKPDYVYTGNLGKYWYSEENKKEYHEPILLDLFDKFNKEMFNNELKRPRFLIFSKFCFKKETINTFGYFQYSSKKHITGNLYYGIYISVEQYLISGQKEIEDTLKHEMIHAYLEQNNKPSNDSASDFIYMCGWHHVSLFGKSLDYHPDMKEVKVITRRYSLKFE